MGRSLEQPVHVELSTVTGSPAVPLGSTHRSSMSSNTNSDEHRSVVLDYKESGDFMNTRPFVHMEVYNQQILSPIARIPLNLRNSLSYGGYHVMMENHRILNVDPMVRVFRP
ncbi:hypothetical protein RDI58_001544 [Solanum bulbocastanum]|uniref:Uncharacterized protein n=1 Tax=Solanum bulbocastanum TaxID=147425 RepID=A0AAN8YQ16_SOLBU